MLHTASPEVPVLTESHATPLLQKLSLKGSQILHSVRNRVRDSLLRVPGDGLGPYSGKIQQEDIPQKVQELLEFHSVKHEIKTRSTDEYKIGPVRDTYTVQQYLNHLSSTMEKISHFPERFKRRLEHALKKEALRLDIKNLRPCRVHSNDSSVERWGYPEEDFARLVINEPNLLYSEVFEKMISAYKAGAFINRDLISFYCLCFAIEKIKSPDDVKTPFWKNILSEIIREIETK